MAFLNAIGISQGDVAPPGAVVVPEMVIGIRGATGDEFEMCGGHGIYHILVFVRFAFTIGLRQEADLEYSSF